MIAFLNQFKLIIIIIAMIIVGGLCVDQIPLTLKVLLYSISNAMRQILLVILPLLILPFMVTGIAAMKTRGAYLILGILIMVFISNFISIMIPFFVSKAFIPLFNINPVNELCTVGELKPKFDFNLTPFIQMETVLLLALAWGLGISLTKTTIFDSFLNRYVTLSKAFFEWVFIPTLPIYVLGTVIKTAHETDFRHLLPTFGAMIILIICTQILYITFLYFIGAGRNVARTVSAIKNAFQSSIVGFSTMSSVVTMPVTLAAAEKNIPEDPASARVIISATVNCHDVGECISLPMVALTIYYIANGIFPDLGTYLIFAFYATVAQFGGIAVPGGSIIIILPFLIRDLGFSNEMCSIIIALSIFMDPVGTANNVLGNGAFAMIVYRAQNSLLRLKYRLLHR